MSDTGLPPVDPMKRTPGGLYVPSGSTEADMGEVLTQRQIDDLNVEVQSVVRWCKQWPREKERALGNGDLQDLVLARARTYLWTRDWTTLVYKGAAIALGLVAPPTPQPDNRQARKATERADAKRARRGDGQQRRLQIVPPGGSPVIDEIPPGAREANRFAEYEEGTDQQGPGRTPYELPRSDDDTDKEPT